MKQSEIAKAIAIEAHKGQTRWGGEVPYINHPLCVALMVEEAHHSDDFIATALLHDVLEDTHITALDLLEKGISNEVVEAVTALTKTDETSYFEYLTRVKKNYMAKVVKYYDIVHNMSCFSESQKRSKRSLYDKYELALNFLNM